jgi:hypothetical protein
VKQWPSKIFRAGKRPFVVENKKARARGTFGLDHAFPVDAETIHVSVLRWLNEVLPPRSEILYIGADPVDDPEIDKFNRLGGRSGVPRLWVFMDGAFAFALEIKTQAQRLSSHQQTFQDSLRKLGFKVATVRGVEETRQALASWGVQTRERKL